MEIKREYYLDKLIKRQNKLLTKIHEEKGEKEL